MKKRYIILPVVCVLALISIVIAVALVLNSGYLKKLSYDHMSPNIYNGVEVVGDDGFFYLVKDGKKVSKGYVSLQSVNDFYSEELITLANENQSVVLFDYYLAKAPDNLNYLLVNSLGEEVTVVGESLSLDVEKTQLPYLVFTDNSNGRKAAVSLHRLDSDLSYKSGSELTLRPFKNVTPCRVSDEYPLYTYLITDDVTNEPQQSYFRSDGIKISSGNDIQSLEFTAKSTEERHLYFFNAEDKKIFSVGGELIASDVVEILRAEEKDWKYAVCQSEESGNSHITVFSPQKVINLSDSKYKLSTLIPHNECIIIQKSDLSGIDVINVNMNKLNTYVSAVPNGNVITALQSNGEYVYLDEEGMELLRSPYGDMTPTDYSDEICTVFSSVTYDTESQTETLHFARAGENVYTLDVTNLKISRTKFNEKISDYACFTVEESNDESTQYSILTPFSVFKTGEKYDAVLPLEQNGISWILATSYSRHTYDIIDPYTSRAVMSFNCSAEDFAGFSFEHTHNIALATDKRDSDTAVHISVIKLLKYTDNDLMRSAEYYALYRPLPYSSVEFYKTGLQISALGSDLLIESDPIETYTAKNYMITHTASGSEVFSLDAESYQLTQIASLPYRLTDVLTDMADTSVDYFVVENDSGLKGLYNRSEAVLAPYYNDITSAENGCFIVGLRGAYGVIQSKKSEVKTVIDFLYSSIYPLGEGGYYTINDSGDSAIYQGKKIILAESVQSIQPVFSYTVDESGHLSVTRSTLLSADGHLYIHRSEQSLELVFQEYDGCDENIAGILNQRSKVVHYYNGSELIHKEVIHPQSNTAELYPSPTDGGWFFSDKAEDQTEPVTVQDIIDSEDHVIKLYSKIS